MNARTWKQFKDMVDTKLQELGESENVLLGDIHFVGGIDSNFVEVNKEIRINKQEYKFLDIWE